MGFLWSARACSCISKLMHSNFRCADGSPDPTERKIGAFCNIPLSADPFSGTKIFGLDESSPQTVGARCAVPLPSIASARLWRDALRFLIYCILVCTENHFLFRSSNLPESSKEVRALLMASSNLFSPFLTAIP